jgi:hypothetical protein
MCQEPQFWKHCVLCTESRSSHSFYGPLLNRFFLRNHGCEDELSALMCCLEISESLCCLIVVKNVATVVLDAHQLQMQSVGYCYVGENLVLPYDM